MHHAPERAAEGGGGTVNTVILSVVCTRVVCILHSGNRLSRTDADGGVHLLVHYGSVRHDLTTWSTTMWNIQIYFALATNAMVQSNSCSLCSARSWTLLNSSLRLLLSVRAPLVCKIHRERNTAAMLSATLRQKGLLVESRKPLASEKPQIAPPLPSTSRTNRTANIWRRRIGER